MLGTPSGIQKWEYKKSLKNDFLTWPESWLWWKLLEVSHHTVLSNGNINGTCVKPPEETTLKGSSLMGMRTFWYICFSQLHIRVCPHFRAWRGRHYLSSTPQIRFYPRTLPQRSACGSELSSGEDGSVPNSLSSSSWVPGQEQNPCTCYGKTRSPCH